MKTEILYEDPEILVIYKPAGLASQSARVTQPDVVSEICSYLKTTYVGLVHRLDQPVEGLMVLARTKQSAAKLSSQLNDGSLKKTYYAVVYVQPENGQTEKKQTENKGSGETTDGFIPLVDYMIKNGKTSKAEIVTNVMPEKRPKEAVKAELFYRFLRRNEKEEELSAHVNSDDNKDCTQLLEIRLVTGRFHQIRAQLSHAGMPLLGDSKYGSSESQEISHRLGVRDVALCAYKLSFVHPKTKKEMEFKISPRKPVFNSYDF